MIRYLLVWRKYLTRSMSANVKADEFIGFVDDRSILRLTSNE